MIGNLEIILNQYVRFQKKTLQSIKNSTFSFEHKSIKKNLAYTKSNFDFTAKYFILKLYKMTINL